MTYEVLNWNNSDKNDDYTIQIYRLDGDEGKLVEINLRLQNSLQAKLIKLGKIEYNELLVDNAETQNLLEGL